MYMVTYVEICMEYLEIAFVGRVTTRYHTRVSMKASKVS